MPTQIYLSGQHFMACFFSARCNQDETLLPDKFMLTNYESWPADTDLFKWAAFLGLLFNRVFL